jgi:HSP20 family protein
MAIEPRRGERRRRALTPFEEIEESLGAMWDALEGSLEPLAHIEEEEKVIRVTVDLPLVRKQDIKIRVLDDTLDVEAKLNRCVTFDRWGTVQRRCEFRFFHKSIHLPALVTATGAKATFKKGILVVELPKTIAEHEIKVD